MIRLHKNLLNGNIPKSFKYLTKMEELSFHDNSLEGSLPKFLGNWKNLRRLTIHYNNFSGCIPQELLDIQKLRFLYINYNRFSCKIPPFDQMKSLQRIYLLPNNFTAPYPKEISLKFPHALDQSIMNHVYW
jgi:Leucine-rich repeat (LRR) protein